MFRKIILILVSFVFVSFLSGCGIVDKASERVQEKFKEDISKDLKDKITQEYTENKKKQDDFLTCMLDGQRIGFLRTKASYLPHDGSLKIEGTNPDIDSLFIILPAPQVGAFNTYNSDISLTYGRGTQNYYEASNEWEDVDVELNITKLGDIDEKVVGDFTAQAQNERGDFAYFENCSFSILLED